jgi:D-arabinose 1-dehydrogenase-like Zn-dependent alcohol dehydrogenase
VEFYDANFGVRRRDLTGRVEKGIAADVELIPIEEINKAYERMLNNDVRYRFVVDIASLK